MDRLHSLQHMTQFRIWSLIIECMSQRVHLISLDWIVLSTISINIIKKNILRDQICIGLSLVIKHSIYVVILCCGTEEREIGKGDNMTESGTSSNRFFSIL